ncbi:MAG: hypothetical protein ABI185_09455 [Ginsengibacter sp.]
MTIYLDSCVYQDLKKEKNGILLNLIKADKSRNIYCFSEAHLFDLTRDSTNEKFDDMDFIESIADNNCYYYKKKICFEYITPKEYYNSFEWPNLANLKNEVSVFSGFENILKSIPLNFNGFITSGQIPIDCPVQFIELLNKTTNFYEFASAMLDFTESLTNEQKSFKEFIKYLHKNSLIGKIYESFGIKGFDGEKITNKEEFLQSYGNHFIKKGEQKYRYNLFTDMYCGLEILGIVKGKPKKQKMMNLINDARHSFFGGFCDILVSKDEDFLKKTKFLYNAYDLNTLVLSVPEFHEYLTKFPKDESSILELVKEIQETNSKNPEREWEEDGGHFCLKTLNRTFYNYFDAVTFVFENDTSFYYFSKYSNSFSTGVLTKQIEYVTNKLAAELGDDIYKRNMFDSNEIVDGKWYGRNWFIGEALVALNFTNGLFLRFYPIVLKDEG